jgi:hypothetical protein
VTVFFTIIYAFIINLIAKKLGGTGTYSKLVYAFAASLAPIALIGTVASFIPIVQYLVFPLLLYSIALNVLAVRAVHQFRWGRAIASTLTPILLGAIAVAVAVGAFLIVLSRSETAKMMGGEDYTTLTDALNQRWKNDVTLPTTSVGFGTNDALKYPGDWLVIEMSYTGTCTSTPSDPCNQLANEFAQIVFDNYRKLNDIDGIGIVIGKKPHYLYVEPSDIQFQKYLTIEEWRKELSLGK